MKISYSNAAVAAALVVTACTAALFAHRQTTLAFAADGKSDAPYTTWKEYGGSPGGAQYSALKQIDKTNAKQLQQVWFYPAGNNGFRYGSNPIVIDGMMYVVGKDNNVVGLDAATGKEAWVYVTHARNMMHRGLMYWESKDRSQRRVVFAANNMLREVDAKTGAEVPDFGNNGAVDLREGLGRTTASVRGIQPTTPGRVFENLIILGSSTGEDYDSPPGDIRAYDAVTGKMAWIFHTVPHPGEMGYETWPKDAYKYVGGVNNWGDMTLDEKKGVVYIPLGAPTYDFYGADRHGQNLFADCVLALDARTGKYLWHFQATHHDLWDYDLETGPKMMTIKHDGKMVDILAEPGKNGYLWVLNRDTGKPIWPVEERPVPKSDVPGEESSPTQPFPTHVPPFSRQKFTSDMVNPYITDEKEKAEIKKAIDASRNEGLYTPPGLGTTMETPGNNGGSNWGSGAVDFATNTLYIVAKDAPSLLHLAPRQPRQELVGGTPESQGNILYIQNCQSCHLANRKGQPPSIPALESVVQQTSADHVKTVVHNGQAPMPGFASLSPKDLDNLVAYLQAPEKANIPGDVMARLMAPATQPVRLGPQGTRYYTGYGYMNSEMGLPAISPPWSTLTAYDMNQGTIKWQIPLGNIDALEAKGIVGTGGFWPRGGAVVTAGGLIVVGTVSDEKIHIYDKDTGKQISEISVPNADPQGIPAIYEVNGREFIAMSAGSHIPTVVHMATQAAEAGAPPRVTAQPQTGPTTQGYYVYALPQKNASSQK